MKPYLALFRSNMRLTLRDRSVIFFNYLFPFIFFFAFAELFHAGTGAGIAYFVGTVLTMGILGNGLWGAGMRAVQDREADILRRYKVTPIGPLPILVAAVVISPRSGRAARGGALSIRDAAAAELDLAVLDDVARRVRLPRDRADPRIGDQYDAGGDDSRRASEAFQPVRSKVT